MPLPLLGFSASAWSIAVADQFIGWDDEARQRNLALAINNARFLILPWIPIDNLASYILSQYEKRIAQDLGGALCNPFCGAGNIL